MQFFPPKNFSIPHHQPSRALCAEQLSATVEGGICASAAPRTSLPRGKSNLAHNSNPKPSLSKSVLTTRLLLK